MVMMSLFRLFSSLKDMQLITFKKKNIFFSDLNFKVHRYTLMIIRALLRN